MKKEMKLTIILIITILLITTSLILLETSQVNATSFLNVLGNAFRGAQLYDNWMAVLDVPAPEGEPILWYLQDTDKIQGADTWRCQECHGWDYKGDQGAYADGNHVTGFKGIQDMIGKTNEEIIAYLDGTNNIDHNFIEFFSEKEMNDLAAFMLTKQVDLKLLVNYDTREILGHQENGQVYYIDTCQECHGENAANIIVNHDGFDMYISDLAYVDPWQAIHHARFGKANLDVQHAFEESGLSLYKIIDVLAYVQTLPTNNTHEELEEYNPVVKIDTSSQGRVEPILVGGAIIFIFIASSWIIIAKNLKKQEKALSNESPEK